MANKISRLLKAPFRVKTYKKILGQSPLADVLNKSYYHSKTVKMRLPVNNNNQPIPWFTYPAIEYLDQFDLTGKLVYEWGSGHSSLFFARKGCSVYSIEHDKEWFEQVQTKLLPNQHLYLKEPTVEDYVNSIESLKLKYDIILIDGGLFRYECAQIASKYLAEGGMIILDNSDWFKNSAKVLRDEDFIEVDFHGFGPINYYTWTTSFFLSRNIKLIPINDIQPHYSEGGLRQVAD